MAECRVTNCGGKCGPGEIQVTTQPCGSAKPVTRHSTKPDSALCCPVSSAPDPKNCRWDGDAPFCNGACKPGEVALESNRWGDGKYCEDGNKFYCCTVPEAKNEISKNCYWTDTGSKCKNNDILMTFAGTFLQDLQTATDILDFVPFVGLIGDSCPGTRRF